VMAGNSEVELSVLDNKSLLINNTGNGNFKLKGKTSDFTIGNKGDLTVDGDAFSTKELMVNGVGDAEISMQVSDSIEVGTMGQTKIEYVGNPKIYNHAIGQSKIEKKK
ncbi:MAG: DUF2807 domain-containing protein, partial [Pseudomonadota bacterium]|nr:DUF2807 domain-containing protein [Pseudomonadota bacterium]